LSLLAVVEFATVVEVVPIVREVAVCLVALVVVEP
jgi:hypothetical protein